MPKFFLDSAPGEAVTLDGEDGRHIARSLRMRPGEALTLCDCRGTDYDGVIDAIDGESVTVRILGSRPCAPRAHTGPPEAGPKPRGSEHPRQHTGDELIPEHCPQPKKAPPPSGEPFDV